MPAKRLPKNIRRKANNIIENCNLSNFSEFKGKRITRKRECVSVPITSQYKVLYMEEDGELVFQGIFKHDEYERIINS